MMIFVHGMTPLYNAIALTVKAVESSVEGKEDISVVVAIQTDGYENTSRHTKLEDVRNLIAEKEAKEWEFLFMRYEMDTYGHGADMRFKKEQILAYKKGRDEPHSAFRAAAMNTRDYTSRRRHNTGFSLDQKNAAGDRESDHKKCTKKGSGWTASSVFRYPKKSTFLQWTAKGTKN